MTQMCSVTLQLFANGSNKYPGPSSTSRPKDKGVSPHNPCPTNPHHLVTQGTSILSIQLCHGRYRTPALSNQSSMRPGDQFWSRFTNHAIQWRLTRVSNTGPLDSVDGCLKAMYRLPAVTDQYFEWQYQPMMCKGLVVLPLACHHAPCTWSLHGRPSERPGDSHLPQTRTTRLR